MSKFIDKAIEMQELCIRGNVKRNPEDRKETAKEISVSLVLSVV